MDFGDWYWLIWLGAGFVPFEIIAAIYKPEWTLSHHVWKWFGVRHFWEEYKIEEHIQVQFGSAESWWVILAWAIRIASKKNYAGLRFIILAGLCISTTLHFLVFSSWIPIVVFSIGAVWSIFYHYRYEQG